MDPTVTHEQYDEMVDAWRTCRDAAGGQRKVRAGGELYLPRLGGQAVGSNDYKAYLNRGSYFNATGRTVKGMCGLVFRKDPVIEGIPDTWKADITMTGKSLDGLARDTMKETLTVARYGFLVDYPTVAEPAAGTKRTVAQVQAAGLRPYLTPYCAEAITYWEHGQIGTQTKLVQVILKEDYLDDKGEKQVQYRELRLEPAGYVQLVWRETTGDTKNGPRWAVFETIIPRKGGAKLQDIPFFFHGPEETTGDVCEIPIEDLANVNISHFRNSCDRENGAHVSGLPTPVITGVDQLKDEQGNDIKIHLGSNTAIILPSGADAKFLEVQFGFTPLKELMEEKKMEMAVLGGRLIAPEKRSAETAETTQTKKGDESSVLADIARSISVSITKALEFMVFWAGTGGKVKFELNRDYLVLHLSPQELTALVGAHQAGRLSDETLFEIFKKRELVPESLTFENEEARLAVSTPPLGMMTEDADDGE